MKRLLKKPALHFVLLGSALFAYQQWAQWRDSYQLPAPSEQLLQTRIAEWANTTRSLPSAAQQQAIRQSLIDEQILFQEALRYRFYLQDPVVLQRLRRDAEFLSITGSEQEKVEAALELGLHRDDEVVRQRLIQQMEELGRRQAELHEPSRETLESLYAESAQRWQQEAAYQISHVFFSADSDRAEQRAATAAQTLASQPDIATEQAIALGDNFLLGHQLTMQSRRSLGNSFGLQFVTELEQQYELATNNRDVWLGPISSVYGQHLVKVHRFQAPRQRSLEEVKSLLMADYLRGQHKLALQDYIEKLRKQYRISES